MPRFVAKKKPGQVFVFVQLFFGWRSWTLQFVNKKYVSICPTLSKNTIEQQIIQQKRINNICKETPSLGLTPLNYCIDMDKITRLYITCYGHWMGWGDNL